MGVSVEGQGGGVGWGWGEGWGGDYSVVHVAFVYFALGILRVIRHVSSDFIDLFIYFI
jgi:hypothetical protein